MSSNYKTSSREAELARRRGVVSDDEGRSEEDASPPGASVPSTSGVRIRDEVTLCNPVRVVDRTSVDKGRKRKECDDVVDIEDDTEVEDCAVGESGNGESRREGSEREEGESDPEPPHKLLKRRGRGRPATVPGHAGKFTAEKVAARNLARKERKRAEEQMKALDPATELRQGTRLRKARREEQELLMEYRDFSSAGLTAVVTEQVTLLRKVAQRCTNLNGTTVKAMWDATNSIAAVSAALNMRAQSSGAAVASPEWEDMREELRQLRVDLGHLRAINQAQKEDLRRGREELERLQKELERERDDRRRDKERERKKEEERSEGRRGKESLQRSPKRATSPGRLRPRTARRVIVEESEEEEEGMDVEREEEEIVCPPSPVLDCRPKLGEIIPPAYRPPLKGVQAIIEQEKPFEGARPPPDERAVPRSTEGPKPLTMEDLNMALETLLPRLLGRMGLAAAKSADRQAGASLPRPDPDTAPVKGHTSSGGGGEKRPHGPQIPSAGGGAGVTLPQPSASTGSGGPAKKKKRKGGKGKKGGQNALPGAQAPILPQPAPAPLTPAHPPQAGEEWSKVVGRREKGRGKAQHHGGPQAPPAPKAAGPRGPTPVGSANKALKAKRLRTPKMAAVSLTCPEGTYAEVLSLAKEKISLKDLGIETIRNKRAVTGALLLEVTGTDGDKGATLLAKKMQELLAGREGVRVDRPTKKAEFRVKDLDFATSPLEVAKAVAEAAGCDLLAVKVGPLSTPARGLAMARVEAPVAAVKLIVTAAKLRVGWSLCRVELLDARPLTCFRCLEEGHTRRTCTSQTDRSGICYRCGGVGHTAKECTGTLMCPVCSTGGNKVVHRLGGVACVAAQKKRRKGGKKRAGEARIPAAPPQPTADKAQGAPAASQQPSVVSRKRKGGKEAPKPQRPRRDQGDKGAEGTSPLPALPEVEMTAVDPVGSSGAAEVPSAAPIEKECLGEAANTA